MKYNTLNQFDVVRLIHTKNIKYLSGPPGRPTSPKGDWTIIGFVDKECILAKQSTVVRVPYSDVKLLASYQPSVLGKKLSEEWKRKMSLAQKGKHHSEETKQKISQALKGRIVTQETKQKMSLASKGKPKSEEHKGKNHHLWKGGITPINIQIRTCFKYKLWRTSIFIRASSARGVSHPRHRSSWAGRALLCM